MVEDVLYSIDKKELESEEDDVWDDTELIKAYDKAINNTKKKIIDQKLKDTSSSIPDSTDKDTKDNKLVNGDEQKFQWKVGAHCRAIYSEDGIEYEAYIKSINLEKGTCEVVYIGYDNEEQVNISSLKPSRGNRARKMQQKCIEISGADVCNGPYTTPRFSADLRHTDHPPVIPPPPPPQVMGNFPSDEDDAFSAMMMAWYMSGYHTGYYQGLTRARCNHPSHHMNGTTSK